MEVRCSLCRAPAKLRLGSGRLLKWANGVPSHGEGLQFGPPFWERPHQITPTDLDSNLNCEPAWATKCPGSRLSGDRKVCRSREEHRIDNLVVWVSRIPIKWGAKELPTVSQPNNTLLPFFCSSSWCLDTSCTTVCWFDERIIHVRSSWTQEAGGYNSAAHWSKTGKFKHWPGIQVAPWSLLLNCPTSDLAFNKVKDICAGLLCGRVRSRIDSLWFPPNWILTEPEASSRSPPNAGFFLDEASALSSISSIELQQSFTFQQTD